MLLGGGLEPIRIPWEFASVTIEDNINERGAQRVYRDEYANVLSRRRRVFENAHPIAYLELAHVVLRFLAHLIASLASSTVLTTVYIPPANWHLAPHALCSGESRPASALHSRPTNVPSTMAMMSGAPTSPNRMNREPRLMAPTLLRQAKHPRDSRMMSTIVLTSSVSLMTLPALSLIH